jgi:hypothetical protein
MEAYNKGEAFKRSKVQINPLTIIKQTNTQNPIKTAAR